MRNRAILGIALTALVVSIVSLYMSIQRQQKVPTTTIARDISATNSPTVEGKEYNQFADRLSELESRVAFLEDVSIQSVKALDKRGFQGETFLHFAVLPTTPREVHSYYNEELEKGVAEEYTVIQLGTLVDNIEEVLYLEVQREKSWQRYSDENWLIESGCLYVRVDPVMPIGTLSHLLYGNDTENRSYSTSYFRVMCRLK